eukprot:scaffold29717_cov57-Phaeocystis_antarctica.AAC.1
MLWSVERESEIKAERNGAEINGAPVSPRTNSSPNPSPTVTLTLTPALKSPPVAAGHPPELTYGRSSGWGRRPRLSPRAIPPHRSRVTPLG